MKKREVVLILALIGFGLVYQAIEKGKVRLVHDFSFYSDERKLAGSRFVEFPVDERQFAPVKKITLENPAGEVVIGRSPDDQVHVKSLVRVYYSDRSDVDQLRKKTVVNAELLNGELKIAGRHETIFPYRRIRILFHLSVPENIILSISNQEGSTIIRGTGKDVRVVQENGDLFMENIPSGLNLRLKNCAASIKTISENVDITAYRSNVRLEDALSTRIEGEHGDFSIKNIKDKVFVEHAHGKVDVDGVDKAEINAKHCRIRAKNILNGVIISSKYESVFLENIKGDARLSSRLGRIDIHGITSPNVVIEDSFADIVITDYSGEKLDVLLKNGKLDLQVKNVTDRINIESRHAELNLRFGSLLDPTFSIKTKQGQISLQSPLDFEEYEENTESFANRSGQKPEILISNVYGDVSITSSN